MKNFTLYYIVSLSIAINLNAQVKIPLTNINSYESFITEQKSIKSTSKLIVIWGTFHTWGKYDRDYNYYCQGKLDINIYKKINSFIDVNIFSDSSRIPAPITKTAKVLCDYKEGDIIKLKVRIYKDCRTVGGKPFFLVEEVL